MEEGILFTCPYPLNSIKTHGMWNILSRAEQRIRICSGSRWRGGSWDEGGWQMASITRHISLKWWNEAYLQNLRISFLFLNACLSWMHLHSLPCSGVVFSVDPPLSSWEPQLGSNLCTEDALPRHGNMGTVVKTEQNDAFAEKIKWCGLCLTRWSFFSPEIYFSLWYWWESY